MSLLFSSTSLSFHDSRKKSLFCFRCKYKPNQLFSDDDGARCHRNNKNFAFSQFSSHSVFDLRARKINIFIALQQTQKRANISRKYNYTRKLIFNDIGPVNSCQESSCCLCVVEAMVNFSWLSQKYLTSYNNFFARDHRTVRI